MEERLYPYQLRAYKAIMDGRSVIIQAPTGAGKTRAALYPYFANLERTELASDTERSTQPLPLTCRYAVPMRVLATQFEREYHNFFMRFDQLRGTRVHDTYTRLGIKLPTMQTGDTPEDPLFEAPLTFCTIDQLLASFIGTPYSVSPRQANIDVGAVVGSYLILDEFHLYPVDHGNGARLTSLAMLRMLRQFSPFVLMTATLSGNFLDALAKMLDADVIQVKTEELSFIQAGRTRTLFRCSTAMSAETILEKHSAAYTQGLGASLVVCNTVARAQEMYQQLRKVVSDSLGIQSPHVMLLHSRFTSEDRRAKGEQLEAWVGEKAWKSGENPNVIVVATQVIEVGLNISAGVLHTELAPANALIQRFGRCARFAQQHGDVIVYPIPTGDNGKVLYRPYSDALCETTWKHLEQILPDDTARMLFGLAEEQKLVDAVHTAEDQRMLDTYFASEMALRRTIMETLTTHDSGKRSQLIRDVDSVSVLIHPEPEYAITTKPFSWTSFSLRPGTLRGAWESLNQRQAETDTPWVMKQILPAGEQETSDEEDVRREPIYTWDAIHHPSEIKGALRIALHPNLATYDQELGFRLLMKPGEETTNWISSPADSGRGKPNFSKRQQRSYLEHISGLMRAYNWSVRREVGWLAVQIQSALSLPDGAIDSAIRFAIAFHDLGKLCVGWQQWAHSYQRQLVAQHGARFVIPPGRRFLAKTDMLDKWQDEVAVRNKLTQKRPPSHAVAGALATPGMFSQFLRTLFGVEEFRSLTEMQQHAGQALLRATLSAIVHHHSPNSTTYDTLNWESEVSVPIAEALDACQIKPKVALLDLSPRPPGKIGEEWLISPERDGETATWLAFVLVRALRLCDQRAEREL